MFSSSETFDFSRRAYGAATMSRQAFLAALSLFIAGGLVAATLVASVTYGMKPNGLWIIGYFLVSIPGILISAKSDSWVVSAIGYAMVVVATGALMGPYVAGFTIASVLNVVALTALVTVGVGIAGVVYPKSVEHWGGVLFAILLVLILGRLLDIILLAFGVSSVPMAFWDYLGAALFTVYIFYDMNRAVRMPATMDNAVDHAVALYLDIINLFMHLLAIFGKRD